MELLSWVPVVALIGGGLVVAAMVVALVVGATNPLYRDLGPIAQVQRWLRQKLGQ